MCSPGLLDNQRKTLHEMCVVYVALQERDPGDKVGHISRDLLMRCNCWLKDQSQRKYFTSFSLNWAEQAGSTLGFSTCSGM